MAAQQFSVRREGIEELTLHAETVTVAKKKLKFFDPVFGRHSGFRTHPSILSRMCVTLTVATPEWLSMRPRLKARPR